MARTLASLTVGISTIVALADATVGARMDRSSLVITINVRSQTNVSPRTLFDARGDAARLYRDVGIDLVWATTTSDLVIVLASETEARLMSAGTRTLGQAVVDRTSRIGRVAYVYLDRVDDLAAGVSMEPGDILGCVIAHEIAHLLGLSHAARGLMRSGWDVPELSLAAQGLLSFTSDQRAVLRRGIDALAVAGAAVPFTVQP